MSNEIVKTQDDQFITDIKNTQKMCQTLLQSPHYKKMGAEGIFAIVEKAKSVGINPLEALNGGMYYVKGKVELTSAMMNHLIRLQGHSITKGKNSTEEVCYLHGKRRDNGDTWVCSFSIEEAKKAGIYTGAWMKYPQDMLFARALSRLARQLFPDVIKGCYVQGEISDAPDLNIAFEEIKEEVTSSPIDFKDLKTPEAITHEEFKELENWLGENHKLKHNILAFINKKWGIDSLEQMPKEIYEHSLKRAKEQYCEANEHYGESYQAVGE